MREKPLTEFIGSKKAAKEHKEKPAEPKVVGLKGPWELPEGWRWVRLGKITKLTSGGTPSRKIKEYWENGTIPWVKSGELEDNVIYTTEEKITERGLKESSAKMFPKGTLLVALYGATVGKTAILGIDATTNQAVCAVLPPNRREAEWDARYLQYYFIAIRPMLISKSGGGAQPNIYLHTLRRLEVPLPPLEEQKHIVAKLDEVRKRLEEAKHLAREAREKVERLMASALHEVFSKAKEKGWEWMRLEKIATIRKGTINPQDYPDETFELYSIPAYHSTGKPEVKLGKQIKSNKFVVKPGDILFGKLNPHLPKVWIVKPNKEYRQIASTELFPIVVNNEKALTQYIYWYLLSPQVREELVRKVIGTTGSRKRISKGDILHLRIPLPPLEEQKSIVAYLDSIQERAQMLVKLYEEQEQELEKLFPAILNKAFRGELV